MAKNKKKNKKSISPAQLEQKARDDLKNHRYRKARDGFKELCKHDRDKYMPELILSYKGLAKQMVESGQTGEAQVVIDHIKTLDKNADNIQLETEISLKRADSESAVEQYVKYFAAGGTHLETGAVSKGVDAMVVAFKELPLLAEKRPDLNGELIALQRAIECVSASDFDTALEHVRAIKRNSVFSHWKLLVKGMAAFYVNDDVKAGMAFRMIPGGSAPFKISRAFLLLIDKNTIKEVHENDLKFVSTAAVRLASFLEFAQTIPRADYLWRRGRYRDSFDIIRKKHSGFPSEARGFEATLTMFFYNAPSELSHPANEKLLQHFRTCRYDSELVNLLSIKAAANFYKKEDDSYFISELWEDFLDQYEVVHGANNKFKAIIYAAIGDVFAVLVPDSGFFQLFGLKGGGSFMEDPEEAVEYFEKSIACNDEDRDVYLKLLNVYELEKENSKSNKLLDNMIKRFPEDKEILVKAGKACVERKVYVKGLKYLEQAFELDSLDSETKERLIWAVLKAALNNFKKKKVKAGASLMKRVVELGDDKSAHFNFGRAFLYARWAAMEFVFGSETAANEAWQTAKSFDVHYYTLLYFTTLMLRVYEAPHDIVLKFEGELEEESSKNNTAYAVLELLKVLEYVNLIGKSEHLFREKERITRLSYAAAKNKHDKCSRETAIGITKYVFELNQTSLFNNDYNIFNVFAKKMFALNKNDPFFLFSEFMIKKRTHKYRPKHKDIKKLGKIEALAKELNDHELVKVIHREIEFIETLINGPVPDFREIAGYEEDDDLDEDLLNKIVFGGDDESLDDFEDGEVKPRRRTKKKAKPPKKHNEKTKKEPEHEQLEFDFS